MRRSAFTCIVALVIVSLSINIEAQQIDFDTDLETINKKLSEKEPDPYKRPYIYKDEPSVIKKINPFNVLFGGALYVYQNVFSKQISSSCLYTPSCSEFSKEAIREYGALKGVILSYDRIHRCNSFSAIDLKNQKKDPMTNRYIDPVSKYKKVNIHDAD